MRRARRILLLAATLALAGCPAAHGSFPSRACDSNKDCYEGEVCDTDSNLCVSNDASTASGPQDLAPTSGDAQ